ncbi:MAG: NADH-quinone oxidoreductase subunit E [Firmicutes bacterium HGW-Firmicutes-12]|jgi:NADH-quinone oxidoreductase subunit E|nr:MAG: NADH-quinone oxidoreductase subunit E [Firmicutes bacterium HGW-Firmicutes-12]
MCKQLTEKDVCEIIASHQASKEKLLSILLDIQDASGQNCIVEEWARVVSAELDLPLTKIYDVITFYEMLSEKPRGKNIIEICKSTPCHFIKGVNIVNIFEEELCIKMGETTPDNLFTLQYTSCVGACDIAPVAKIGDEVYGNLSKDKIVDIIKSYREAAICQK